jgi:hypothetical protein
MVIDVPEGEDVFGWSNRIRLAGENWPGKECISV